MSNVSTSIGRSRTALVLGALMGFGSFPLASVGDDVKLRAHRKPSRALPKFNYSNRVPHQGKREIARRLRQMSGVKLDSNPRRLWTMKIPFLGREYFDSKRSTLARLRFAKGTSALRPHPVVLI